MIFFFPEPGLRPRFAGVRIFCLRHSATSAGVCVIRLDQSDKCVIVKFIITVCVCEYAVGDLGIYAVQSVHINTEKERKEKKERGS